MSAEGLRVVLQVLSDGPHDLSPFLAMGFLGVMDKPDTRQFLRPGVDIEVGPSTVSHPVRTTYAPQIVLAGFTETQSKGSSQEERVRASAKIITHFLQSWSGAFAVSPGFTELTFSYRTDVSEPERPASTGFAGGLAQVAVKDSSGSYHRARCIT